MALLISTVVTTISTHFAIFGNVFLDVDKICIPTVEECALHVCARNIQSILYCSLQVKCVVTIFLQLKL